LAYKSLVSHKDIQDPLVKAIYSWKRYERTYFHLR